METLAEKIKQLPPELQDEVEDFVEFLITKRKRKPYRKPHFNWIGVLRELRDQYTSVELQHKISEWRTEEK
ncbi:hypothetical protein B1H10_03185 [candidate division KSB1 bacterium 4484_188]|nr:MAG: hypothetical protein B1H10_03185 [candidate division KSB1 bacterium 4484_188]HFE63258.1 DUF2281 domain-containing protein [Caldithrix sp.]